MSETSPSICASAEPFAVVEELPEEPESQPVLKKALIVSVSVKRPVLKKE